MYIVNKLNSIKNYYLLHALSDDKWFACIANGYVKRLRIRLPSYPSKEIQISTTGQEGKSTLKEAFDFYLDCRNSFIKMGNPLNRNSKVLDFGTGWGRIGRFFLRDIQLTNLYGCDVDSGYIDICKETFHSNNFAVNNPFPPTEYSDNYFDYIVGYSVFSHLSEKACLSWIKEFSRILKPGGICALTTRGRWFFNHCESLKTSKKKTIMQKYYQIYSKTLNMK